MSKIKGGDTMHERFGWGTKRLSALAEALTDEYQRFS